MLAQAGVASRRAAEELIAAGRVSVDGKIVREMGRRVDPDTAVVHVDGSRIVLREDLVHLALNKPRGMLSTMSDDRGRPCVGDLVADRGDRLFHVGRLDADTEGLLLLTNDGELGPPADAPVVRGAEDLPRRGRRPGAARPRRRLRDGVELEDGPVAVDSFRLVDAHAAARWWSWCCTRAASTSCAGCWTRSGTRCSGWCAPRSARSCWATSGPGSIRQLSHTEVGSLYRAVGL